MAKNLDISITNKPIEVPSGRLAIVDADALRACNSPLFKNAVIIPTKEDTTLLISTQYDTSQLTQILIKPQSGQEFLPNNQELIPEEPNLSTNESTKDPLKKFRRRIQPNTSRAKKFSEKKRGKPERIRNMKSKIAPRRSHNSDNNQPIKEDKELRFIIENMGCIITNKELKSINIDKCQELLEEIAPHIKDNDYQKWIEDIKGRIVTIEK